MAKLSDLITEIGNSFWMEHGAIEAYVKPLRKAGLLSKGGRGTGAPEVTALDAARLLIAIAAGSPLWAVENVIRYGELIPPPGAVPKSISVLTLSALDQDANVRFEDFLAFFIEKVRRANMEEIKALVYDKLRKGGYCPPLPENIESISYEIYFEFKIPKAGCTVEFSNSFWKDGEFCSGGVKPTIFFIRKKEFSPNEDEEYYGDLWKKATFSDRTISDMAKLLKATPPPKRMQK